MSNPRNLLKSKFHERNKRKKELLLLRRSLKRKLKEWQEDCNDSTYLLDARSSRFREMENKEIKLLDTTLQKGIHSAIVNNQLPQLFIDYNNLKLQNKMKWDEQFAELQKDRDLLNSGVNVEGVSCIPWKIKIKEIQSEIDAINVLIKSESKQ